MECNYYRDGRCRSCSEIQVEYDRQLARKQMRAQRALSTQRDLHWLPCVANAERGFRNKAKMMVGGSVEQPTLGILDPEFHGVDLASCPLYPPGLAASFEPLRAFIRRAAIVPYEVSARRGELKHALVTMSDAEGQPLMLRLVCRSREPEQRIRKHLPWLLEQLPSLAVVTLNLLPGHRASSEGETEILLSESGALPMPVNGLPLYLEPGGFFQTSTAMAAAMYRQASDWIARRQPESVLDLYCGVGGFALHAAAALPVATPVTGVEISARAIACATRSAVESGLPNLRFELLDAEQLPGASSHDADLVVVNPPRRGVGAALCSWLDAGHARWLVYSSCNVDSLAADLALLPRWRAREARLLDMFPHTRHFETMVLLER